MLGLGHWVTTLALAALLASPVAGDDLEHGLVRRAAVERKTALYRQAGFYECPELCSTMLLNLPLHTSLSNDDTHSVFYACLSSDGAGAKRKLKTLASADVSDDEDDLRKKEDVSFVQTSKVCSSGRSCSHRRSGAAGKACQYS